MLHPVSEGSQAVPVAAARFHNRGGDISRVEGFSDCAFGFAVTLLVVSLEVPRTFDGLVSVLRGIPSFGVSFAVLAWIWFHHYRFFRRYGLEDVPTVLLTLLLVFVMLCYVYPLKFLYQVSLGPAASTITPAQLRALFVIYGVGLAAVFSVLAVMHVHAYRCRERLQLNELEQAETRISIAELLGVVGLGLLSCGIALLPVADAYALAGLVYFLTSVVYWSGGRRRRRLRRSYAR
jgi:uncharacterized membrane protein